MRKNRKQQKNNPKQMDLFKTGPKAEMKPTDPGADGNSREEHSGAELLSRLERERALTKNIMERITDNGNLIRAYEHVVSNGGASGTDGMTMEDFREWFGKNIAELRKALLEEKYTVSAVLKVEIPKASGGKRTLGIPTIKDRVVQQAIQQVLRLHYEPYFSDHSYGFRPGRSAHDAIEQAVLYIREGKEWVVDIDLENFFDRINHDRLMQRLSKTVSDKRLLRLINSFLKAGMMDGGLTEQRTQGTPQGGPLSPLLSNIVLDELDRELEERGHSFCRYADDCNIYVRTKKSGLRVMESIVLFIEDKLKLRVNRLKSGVRHCAEVKFLGYTIMETGGIRISDKSITSLRDKVRAITKRNRGVRFEEIIRELNMLLRGWMNYYRLANVWLGTMRDIDQWIRRKLRCYRLKQCRRKYAIVKFLISLGCEVSKSWNVAMYAQGWWHMSMKQAVGKAMGIKWFSQMGLYSLSSMIKV